MIDARVHDLLRIDPTWAAALAAPPWVIASLSHAPWVVVRRACATGGIPIGVRGPTRAQRFAARVDPDDVLERLVPAALIARIDRSSRAPRLARAAHAVDDAARALAITWGPTGAYGFELASGTRATHRASDLDIVLGAGTPPALPALRAFAERCARIEAAHGVPIDAEVRIADGGGIALAELLSGAAVVLAKTRRGPRLWSTVR